MQLYNWLCVRYASCQTEKWPGTNQTFPAQNVATIILLLLLLQTFEPPPTSLTFEQNAIIQLIGPICWALWTSSLLKIDSIFARRLFLPFRFFFLGKNVNLFILTRQICKVRQFLWCVEFSRDKIDLISALARKLYEAALHGFESRPTGCNYQITLKKAFWANKTSCKHRIFFILISAECC